MSNAEAIQRLLRMAVNQPGITDRDMEALLYAARVLRQIGAAAVQPASTSPPAGARLMWGRLRNHIVDPLHTDQQWSICGVVRTGTAEPEDGLDVCRTCLRGWPGRQRFPYSCPAIVGVDDSIGGEGDVRCGNRVVFSRARDGFSCIGRGERPEHRFVACPCDKPTCDGWRLQ